MSLSPNYFKNNILENHQQNPEQLIAWLEGEPLFTHLQEIADYDDVELELPKLPYWQQILRHLRHLFWVNADSLYGRSHVTSELVTEAAGTATTLSIANLINTLTAYPYLYYAFADLGGGGTVLAMLIGILLNKSGNTLGESVCRNRYPGGAIASLGGAVLLNLLLTVFSGSGVELLLNQSGLAEQHSQRLIQEKVMDTTLQEQILDQYQERSQQAQTDCQVILNDLINLNPEHPNRDLLYQRAYGTWGERNRNWSQMSIVNLPLCHKAAHLEQEAQVYENNFKKEKETKQTEINSYGSALLYLQTVHPDIYRINFAEDGQLLSGLEASRLALQRFAQKVGSGDLSGLGFSLFFFMLSLVTSSVAMVKVAMFARREDVLLSWDPVIYQIREELFHRVGQGLYQSYESDVLLEPALLNGELTE